MEDDDEFGDLYTDILVPPSQLAPSSSTAPSKSVLQYESARPPVAPAATMASRGFNWEEDDAAGDDNGAGLGRVSGIGGDFDEPMIPGLAVAPAPAPEPMMYDDGGDDDSDSEDDLQIVLNDNSIPMDRRVMQGMGEEDDDEDDLVIVTGDDVNLGQAMEEQDGGDEAAAGDGERKDGADGGKVAGGVGGRIGYGIHGYNPHHSHFKYVRPGASAAPGSVASTGSAFNQVNPPGTVGLVAGRGRGDWRPTGNKGIPSLQRSYHPGYNASWGSSARSFGGGMDFTLPSHKTVFEVDIDIFEEKPWKMLGVDISDFFNFGLDEDGWKSYCKQLEQYRLETTMQSKIRVYESGRSEQDYDPDLPPELAAAAGLHDGSTENSNFVKVDGGQADISGQERSAARLLPTGRAIQVETGYGERLPSIDMRPPRNRDLDVIIEIELHDDSNDNLAASNGALERPPVGSQVENFKGDHDDGDNDHVTSPNGDTQKEAEKRTSVGGSKHNLDEDYNTVSGAGDAHPSLDGQDASGDQTASYDEERLSHEGSKIDASPSETEAMRELNAERNDDGFDDSLALADSIEGDGEELTSEFELGVPGNDEDSKMANSVEKSKLISRSGPPAHEIANGHEINPSTSDNSKLGSGSSRHHQNFRGGDEEVMQEGQSRIRKPRRVRDDEKPGNGRDNYYRDSRKGKERSNSVTRGREDIVNLHLRRDYGVSPGHFTRPKMENLERQERDVSVRSWQRNEGRKRKNEEIRTRDVPEERGVRQRSKFQENDRLKEDLQYMRKRGDDANWHNRHEKDLGSRFRERDAALMGRHEMVDDLIFRRRNDDEIVMRDHEKLESFHGYRGREDRRKHERAEMLDVRRRDVRRRDDQSKLRQKTDEINNSAKKREESWKQKAKEEDKSRLKQSREGDKLLGVGRNKEEPKGFASDKEYSRRDKRKREGDGELPYRKQERTNSREPQAKAADRNPRNDRSSRQNDLINKEIRKPNSRQGNKVRGGGEHNATKLDKKEQDRRDKVGLKIASKVDGKSINCNGDDCPKPISTGSSSKFLRSDQDKLDMPSSEQEDMTSDDEFHRKSKRGRSKLERWESNKERDANDNFGSSNAPNEIEDKSSKPIQNDPLNNANEVIMGNNVGVSDSQTFEPEKNDNDPHSDTVAKLKKRTERFKLPMPGDKDTSASRKLDAERVAAQNETANESPEIKPERPTRKRRWIAS